MLASRDVGLFVVTAFAVSLLQFQSTRAMQIPTASSLDEPQNKANLINNIVAAETTAQAESLMRSVSASGLKQHGRAAPSSADIYIMATDKVLHDYASHTLPIWRAYAEKQGYGLHVVRNGSVCAPHMALHEYSEWSQVTWAKVCIAKDLASTPSGHREASYNLASSFDVLARTGNAASLMQNDSDIQAVSSRDESYVIIVDADVLVQDPHFDLLGATKKAFSKSDVLMFEDRRKEDDFPGCYGNGPPPTMHGWKEGVCLPQTSFLMFRRGDLAKKFLQQWIDDGRKGPCAQVARSGGYPEQDTLKDCTIPYMHKKASNVLHVQNGYKGIFRNSPDQDFPALVHFPLSLKSSIPEYADIARRKFMLN